MRNENKKTALHVRLVILPIQLYKRYISPLLPGACRFYPTCSVYTVEALKKHGVVNGLLLSTGRLLRCNPLFTGGHDPVPDSFSLFHKCDDRPHKI